MKNQLTVAVALSLFSTVALAHPEHGVVGFYAGFMHPLTGLDHLLVMVGVGALAGKLGAGALWKLPFSFMAMMLVGVLLGAVGFSFAGVETAIAATVMAMGLFLIIALPVGTLLQVMLIALFALMHGFAHAAELDGSASMFGMLVATALLHAAGITIAISRIKMGKYLYQILAWSMMLVGSYWVCA